MSTPGGAGGTGIRTGGNPIFVVVAPIPSDGCPIGGAAMLPPIEAGALETRESEGEMPSEGGIAKLLFCAFAMAEFTYDAHGSAVWFDEPTED